MTDADKLERIRSIVADHDAYGLTRHHEMVLDLTDVLAEKGEPEGGADLYDPATRTVLAHPAQKLAVKAFAAELPRRKP